MDLASSKDATLPSRPLRPLKNAVCVFIGGVFMRVVA